MKRNLCLNFCRITYVYFPYRTPITFDVETLDDKTIRRIYSIHKQILYSDRKRNMSFNYCKLINQIERIF